MIGAEIVNKLDSLDFKKIEKKALQYLLVVVGGYVVIHLATKFIDDNFSFRIAKISNKPLDSSDSTNN